jgi:hypothetical protein
MLFPDEHLGLAGARGSRMATPSSYPRELGFAQQGFAKVGELKGER